MSAHNRLPSCNSNAGIRIAHKDKQRLQEVSLPAVEIYVRKGHSFARSLAEDGLNRVPGMCSPASKTIPFGHMTT